MKVIAITSLTHSRAVHSAARPGARLFEIADIVIDTGTPAGDAAIEVPAARPRMGPLSTIVGAAIVHAIQIEAAALLEATRRGAAGAGKCESGYDITGRS